MSASVNLKRTYDKMNSSLTDSDSENYSPKKKRIAVEKLVPDEILKIIHHNLNNSIAAVMDKKNWRSKTVVKDQKGCFYGYFNSMTGHLTIMADQPSLPQEKEDLICVRFTYESLTKVSLDRQKFVNNVKGDKKKITIAALKILLIMEKIWSEQECHEYSEEAWSDVDPSKEYTGSLTIEGMQALIHDEKSEKIVNLWKSINDRSKHMQNFDTDFLIGLPYRQNPADDNWKSTWLSKDVQSGELLVIRRTNKHPCFGKVGIFDIEKYSDSQLQVIVEQPTEKGPIIGKYLKDDHLKFDLIKRW